MKTSPRQIWMRMYRGRPHWSLTKKHGYTEYVPRNLAVAMFVREQLTLLAEPEPKGYVVVVDSARERATSTATCPRLRRKKRQK